MTTSRELGRRGEETAVDYLEHAGFRVVEQNWRCPGGEVDIVAIDVDAGDLVIVEVKTRRGRRAGHPFEAVTGEKLARLRHLAVEWARQHTGVGRHLRIDVIGITAWRDGTETIDHLAGVQ